MTDQIGGGVMDEQVKEMVRELRQEAADWVGDEPCAILCGSAATLIELLASQLEESRWIPVTERLPPDGDVEVLVYVPTGKYNHVDMDVWQMHTDQPAGYGPSVEIGLMWGNHEFEEVTHWMPLPKPPTPATLAGREHD